MFKKPPEKPGKKINMGSMSLIQTASSQKAPRKGIPMPWIMSASSSKSISRITALLRASQGNGLQKTSTTMVLRGYLKSSAGIWKMQPGVTTRGMKLVRCCNILATKHFFVKN